MRATLACAKGVRPEWPSYGGDPGGTRYSPLKQIHRGNVARLARAWTYHTGELALGLGRDWKPGEDIEPGDEVEAFQTTPLVVDCVLYLSTPSSRVIALDAETGRERWKFDPQAGAGGTGNSCGIEASPTGRTAPTSASFWGPWTDAYSRPTRPSRGPSGRVRAFDTRSGRLMWEFHTVPRPGEISLHPPRPRVESIRR